MTTIDKDLLEVTIIEKCRECSEPVENVIEYYKGEFELALKCTGLNNLCDACHDYEPDEERTPEFYPSLQSMGLSK